MTSPTAHVLFVTIYGRDGARVDNKQLVSALIRRGAKADFASIVDGSLTPRVLAAYTHIVFLTCAQYYEKIREFREFLSRRVPEAFKINPRLRFINAVDVISWNMNKTYLAELQAADFPVPGTTFVDASVDALISALAERQNSGPVVVKPSISASGRETRLVRDPHELTTEDKAFIDDVAKQPEEECKILIQDYLPGISNGEYSLVFFDGECHHAALKVPKAGGFLSSTRAGAEVTFMERNKVPHNVLDVGHHVWAWLMAKFGTLTYARIDGVLNSKDDFILMEIELIEPDFGFDRTPMGQGAVESLCNAILVET